MKLKVRYYLVGISVILGLLLLIYEYGHVPQVNRGLFMAKLDRAVPINRDQAEGIIGIFDRTDKHSDLGKHGYQHTYLGLSKIADRDNLEALSSKIALDKTNLLSLVLTDCHENCLIETIRGDYDQTLKAYCRILAKSNREVLLRWCPEMEVPVHVYPWQYQSPKLYNEAFQHVSKLCKAAFPAIKIVWGPAGYPGAEEYWPGKEVVDLISVTLEGVSEELTNAYPRPVNQAIAIRRKIHRMRFMDKPILVLGPQTIKNKGVSIITKSFHQAIHQLKKEEPTFFSPSSDDQLALKPNDKTTTPLKIGVYDPKKLLLQNESVHVEHLFTDLGAIQNGSFEKEFNDVLSRNHDIIVTFEPWKDTYVRKDTNVLLNTLHGVYDKEFRKLYTLISATNQTVYLRFAHEMEIPIYRYSWQSQDPVLYIKAFRYFMFFDKNHASNVKKVWGPAGDRGSMEWWPGDDAVDYISIAIYGLPDKNITDPAQQETFRKIYDRKSYRMRFANKPFFITEFGVKGPEAYQQKWLEDAATTINQHPEIAGVCYFNLMDNPKVWGNISPPNWSISPQSLSHFVQMIANKRLVMN
ncbi:hypothetical protein [Siphonobacter sp. SORGH_AS_1065]|uniref:hypothetical protein n=1 Tax=Siphonobacter sp. SORGH_AS_1065 TaxID=3041795 RepID=UPI00277D1FC6|nr:hypothetical protein [Siphonobacter sp. SORGH_AS_1065]MDQ1089171.1 beta-mannanase [Siphonobacter sp. SORGH_AS_1065]